MGSVVNCVGLTTVSCLLLLMLFSFIFQVLWPLVWCFYNRLVFCKKSGVLNLTVFKQAALQISYNFSVVL